MKKQKIKIWHTFLLALLLGMTLGFSYLNQTLTINGTAKINNQRWDIHFDNIKIKDGSVAIDTGNSAATIQSSTTEVTYAVTLKEPGDFYEFTVDAINEGSMNGMVEQIVSKMNGVAITSLPDYMEYSISYENGNPIELKHLLKSGQKATYKVHIGFKKDITESQLPGEEVSLSMSFSVTYVQADNTAVDIEPGDMDISVFVQEEPENPIDENLHYYTEEMTIPYEITITNSNSFSLHDIVITSELQDYNYSPITINQLSPSETITRIITYEVSTDDLDPLCQERQLKNTIYITAKDIYNNTISKEIETTEAKIGCRDSEGQFSLSITETSTPANGEYYLCNEQIEWEVSVNPGNLNGTYYYKDNLENEIEITEPTSFTISALASTIINDIGNSFSLEGRIVDINDMEFASETSSIVSLEDDCSDDPGHD